MILNGWKEIARYLGRGVRTVQRWEALGFPIRRPGSRLRTAVLVSTEDIDAWLSKCGSGRHSNVADKGRNVGDVPDGQSGTGNAFGL